MKFAIDQKELEFNDPPVIVWIPVKAAVELLWEDNAKLHSLGNLMASIVKHGWQELPRFDANLINVKGEAGAIKAGNGRLEALALMEKDIAIVTGCPRGLAVDKEGNWIVPILAGTDAEDTRMAMAYAVDSNNLTMYGSDFDDFDIARMWESAGYADIIETILKDNDPELMLVTVQFDDAPYLIDALRETFPQTPEYPDTSTGNKGQEVETWYKLVIYDLDRTGAQELQKELGQGEIEKYQVKVES